MRRAHRPRPIDHAEGWRPATRVGPRVRTSMTVLGLLGTLLGGCYEGFDPLDPEVLAEVARGRGDAEGNDWSGLYVGTFEALECGCSDVGVGEQRFEASLCALLEQADDLGLGQQLDAELVQADGTVRAQALRYGQLFAADQLLLPVLYGPVQSDGRLAVAGVLQADSLIVQGQVLGRFDGTLQGQGSAAVLEAVYQQRYVVDLFGDAEIDVFGEDREVVQSVDCRERIGLTLRWSGPPSVTIPVDVPTDGDEPEPRG